MTEETRKKLDEFDFLYKRQTAVEWLYRWYNDNQEATIKESIIAFEQAKAMEKEQIIETWKHGNLPTFLGRVITAEQYYNETYNK
jgi:hypothetical protein